jgi:hypothetical protein
MADETIIIDGCAAPDGAGGIDFRAEAGGGGGSDIDGGFPDSTYGGVTPIDGGTP